MRRLVKGQHTSRESGNLPIIQNISNSIRARYRQSGACQVDGAIPLLICPVEYGQNALAVILFQEENARLLIFGFEIHQIQWNRSLSQTDHIDQVTILNQREALRSLRQRRKRVSDFEHAARNGGERDGDLCFIESSRFIALVPRLIGNSLG